MRLKLDCAWMKKKPHGDGKEYHQEFRKIFLEVLFFMI